jgi:hypothetical protein
MRIESFPKNVIPLPSDVRLSLDENGIGISNVPFYSRQDKCTGDHLTNWGYYGNGPQCLGSDILQWFGLSEQEATHWSSEVVIRFLGFLPKVGGVIPRDRIVSLVREIREGKCKHFSELRGGFELSDPYKKEFLEKGGF